MKKMHKVLLILVILLFMSVLVCSCEWRQSQVENIPPVDLGISNSDSANGDSLSNEGNEQVSTSPGGNSSSSEDNMQTDSSQEGNSSSNENNEQDDLDQGSDIPQDDDISWDDIHCLIVGSSVDSPIPPYALSCKIPKEYSLVDANIPIMLSFGLVNGSYVDTDNYTHIIFKVENGSEPSFVIKKINIQKIMDSEYNVRIVWDENREWAVDFDYTHTEIIGLPRSLFTGESGRIHISMLECSSTATGEINIGSSAYIFFDYMSDGTNISISVKEH